MKFPPIAILARPVRHQVSATGALEVALRRAGYRVRVDYAHRAPEPVVFCWAWGTSQTVRETNPGAVILTMDHGYTKERARFVNTGWATPPMFMGLNGFGEHAWAEDGGQRARAFGWDRELEEVRRPSGLRRALLLGQVYGDAMIRGVVSDYPAWLRERHRALSEEGYRVTFRPHPVMVRRGQASEYGNLGRLSTNPLLRDDLSQNDLVVALSSNGLVEGYLAGVPVQPWNHGTMLGPLVSEYGSVVPWEHRTEWLNRLAWTQWTNEELEDGTWLKYHAPIMHRLVETGTAYPWHQRTIP